ncbi:hypothetical protein M378DRAFT_178654 [Amanita muscaria Koide BX008]|uniref:Uncharacterized protein n=1 Tax=Amanita muscaria (strain Koide BX008) TaxID=946122 RepID=A0A0C2WSL5_AMAMK|nr:hypothetical protein M378DRAFT_178654 [Amanita muscaria Koide BX008]
MMDSSPVALPPVPRPLKRSASVASLPTPPRTRHRDGKRRGKSRGSLASDSDSDSAAGGFTESSGDEEAEKNYGKVNTHKRRRTNETLEDEDAFWLGEAKSGVPEGKAQGKTLKKHSSFKAKAVAFDPEPEMMHHDVPLIYQRLQQQREQRSGSGSELIQKHDKTDTKSGAIVTSLTTIAAPVSPPPSRRRQPARAAAVTVRPSSPPVTPSKPKRGKRRIQMLAEEFPVRDSPNNPFLDSPSGGKEKATNVKPKSPRTPPPLEEKPTVTYVFRGVRGVYPNPLYNHAKQRALTPPPQSLLPPEHPDYSPDMRCPPRLLFPKAKPDFTSSHWSDDSGGSPEPSTPTRSKATTLSGTDRYKERRKEKEEILHLPRMKAVAPLGRHEHAGRARKTRRSPSPDQTLEESDEAGDDGTDGEGEEEFKPLKLDFGLESGEAKNAGNSKHVKSKRDKNRKRGPISSGLEDEFSFPIAPLKF